LELKIRREQIIAPARTSGLFTEGSNAAAREKDLDLFPLPRGEGIPLRRLYQPERDG